MFHPRRGCRALQDILQLSLMVAKSRCLGFHQRSLPHWSVGDDSFHMVSSDQPHRLLSMSMWKIGTGSSLGRARFHAHLQHSGSWSQSPPISPSRVTRWDVSILRRYSWCQCLLTWPPYPPNTDDLGRGEAAGKLRKRSSWYDEDNASPKVRPHQPSVG